jgi:hypothetical protein
MTPMQELRELSREITDHILVDPWKVLEYARDPNTALHKWFEWDDALAAQRYRLHQLRRKLPALQRTA